MHSIEHGMYEPEKYPTISHKEVVARAIMGKKTFMSDGKDGYRDYLVWLTCLELAKRYCSEEIHFITENITDFSADNKENKILLHDDLLEDLDKYGISRSRFFYWTNLTDFFNECIKQKIEKLENEKKIKKQIETNSKYSDELQSFIGKEIIGSHLSSNELLLPSQNSILKKVDSWDSEIDDVINIDDDNCLLEITIDSFCVIEGEMLLSEYNELQKELDCDDWMWDIVVVRKKNNDVIIVQIMTQLYIHINGKYCISDESISMLQLDHIEDSYCDFC